MGNPFLSWVNGLFLYQMCEDAPYVHIEANFFIRSSSSQHGFTGLNEFTKHSFNSLAFRDTPYGSATCSNFVFTGSPPFTNLSPWKYWKYTACFSLVWIVEPSINTLEQCEATRLLAIFSKIILLVNSNTKTKILCQIDFNKKEMRDLFQSVKSQIRISLVQ